MEMKMDEFEKGNEYSRRMGQRILFFLYFHILLAHLKVKFFPSFLPEGFYRLFFPLFVQK